MSYLHYICFLIISCGFKPNANKPNANNAFKGIDLTIEPNDIEMYKTYGDSISILPSKHWIDRELFKICIKEYNRINLDDSENVYLFYNDTPCITIKYMVFTKGKNAIYDINIGDSLSKFICNIDKLCNQNIKYVQIGIPYAGNNGFELFFNNRKLTKVIITNYAD